LDLLKILSRDDAVKGASGSLLEVEVEEEVSLQQQEEEKCMMLR
jgi:hypothetical protein